MIALAAGMYLGSRMPYRVNGRPNVVFVELWLGILRSSSSSSASPWSTGWRPEATRSVTAEIVREGLEILRDEMRLRSRHTTTASRPSHSTVRPMKRASTRADPLIRSTPLAEATWAKADASGLRRARRPSRGSPFSWRCGSAPGTQAVGGGHSGPAAEHRLPLQRRPRLPGHQRLRRPAEARRDAAHRPARQGGHAVRPLPRRRTRSAGRRATILTGKYSHRNGFYNNTNSRFDGSQTDLPQDAPGRRLPDGRDRQVAPRQRPDRVRRVAHPARPGRLLQPADDPQRPARQAPGLRHRPDHRLQPRLAQEPRQVEAVPADVPAQGPAPRVGARAPPPRPRRRPHAIPSPRPSSTTTPAGARPSTTRT